jgi:hypothetical protein
MFDQLYDKVYDQMNTSRGLRGNQVDGARPSGAGTQRPWPTAGCEPLLLTSA